MDSTQRLGRGQIDSLEWRRSSFSQGSDQTCLDVAFSGPGVLVRNSNEAAGPTLSFTAREWRVFLLGARAGEFDLPPAAGGSAQPREA